MYKRFLILTLVAILLLSISMPVNAAKYYYDEYWRTHDENVTLYLNGSKIECDVPPVIVDGRTLVPVRAFFEQLGAKVAFNERQKKVTITNDEYNVLITIDSSEVYVNGKKETLDVPAKIIVDEDGNGRTMIPVRFISTKMGYNVLWNQEILTVSISNSTAANILEIKTDKNQSGDDVILISLSDIKTPKLMMLSSPSRLVIDFDETVIPDNKYSLDTKGKCFSNIRYSNHEGYARVVLDLSRECTYKTESNNEVFKVYLKPSNEEEITDEETTVDIISDNNKNADENEDDSMKPSPDGGTGLVVIDAGHGGSDPGAIGYDNGVADVYESNVNIDIAMKLYHLLNTQGVNVALTRSSDVYLYLKDRAKYANSLDASLFICIHNNAATIDTAHGTMTYYYNSGEDTSVEDAYGISSKKLAQIIQKKMIEHGGRFDRGTADGSRFVVLNSTKMPAVLVECAFLSNDEEREILKTDSFRQKMAQAIAEGVINALEIMGKR